MTPKVSVIVPVYNVRDYLEKCVNSVREQSFPDWELILVNDGSTDGSEEICRRLARADSRIRVLDRTNGGVGAARNAGMDSAQGEYIAFLDSDDSYAPEHLTVLLTLSEITGADVAAAGAITFDGQGREIGRISLQPAEIKGEEEILRTFLCRSDALYACWNRLFRRTSVGGIRFSHFTRAEDALFCSEVLSRSQSYAVSGECTYRYLRRTGSVTMESSVNALKDQLLAWREIYRLLPEKAPDLAMFVAGKICHDADTVCRPLLKAGEEERLLVTTLHQEFYPLQYEPGRMGPEKRFAAGIYRIRPELYYGINRILNRRGGI